MLLFHLNKYIPLFYVYLKYLYTYFMKKNLANIYIYIFDLFVLLNRLKLISAKFVNENPVYRYCGISKAIDSRVTDDVDTL